MEVKYGHPILLYGSEVWAPNPSIWKWSMGTPILLYGSEVWAPNPSIWKWSMGTQSFYMEVKYGHPILLYGSEVWETMGYYIDWKNTHTILKKTSIWKWSMGTHSFYMGVKYGHLSWILIGNNVIVHRLKNTHTILKKTSRGQQIHNKCFNTKWSRKTLITRADISKKYKLHKIHWKQRSTITCETGSQLRNSLHWWEDLIV